MRRFPRQLLKKLPFHPVRRLRRAVMGWVVKVLTKPISGYELKFPNDITNLKNHIRKGDVVLVEGNERISEVIKYLTQSSWSHAALYVGDEPLKRCDPETAAQLVAQYGDEAHHLLLEAVVESGVVLSPLVKYRDFNIRVCRPYSLTREDRDRLMAKAMSYLGGEYDIKNIVDLARYFLPVSLVPRRFRRRALMFGSGEPTRVICSGMIASLFDGVGFPIVPKFKEPPAGSGNHSLLERVKLRFGLVDERRRFGVLIRTHPSFITPRDFDLSPYFEIIKFNVIEGLKFDYRRLAWDEDGAKESPLEVIEGATRSAHSPERAASATSARPLEQDKSPI